MTYSAQINRAHPSCILFVIDQSGSMGDVTPRFRRRKEQVLADGVNRILQTVVIRCSKNEGVRDYFYVGVIGYSGEIVGSVLSGALAGRALVPISEIADNPDHIEERTKKVEDGAGGLVDQTVRFPIWIEPKALGETPMRQALAFAHETISGWLVEHPDCYPPVVLHFTDGAATDGDPRPALQSLTELSSKDGHVLLFNVHLSSSDAEPVAFIDSANALDDEYALMLFETASELPGGFCSYGHQKYGRALSERSRAFVFNSDAALAIEALDIGTYGSTLV